MNNQEHLRMNDKSKPANKAAAPKSGKPAAAPAKPASKAKK